MKTVMKDWTELASEDVDFKSGNWGWGSSDNEHCVSHVDKDLNETCYKLPAFINEMLRMKEQHGAEGTKCEIRIALGL